MRQSHELAAHLASPSFHPKPFRVYSSPFYRCLQTIQPSVEALQSGGGGDLEVRLENGIGYPPSKPNQTSKPKLTRSDSEWFGQASYFTHPPPSTPAVLRSHFPTLLPHHTPEASAYTPHLLPSPHGESITHLHNRLATALHAVIADLDAEIARAEAPLPPEQRTPKAVLFVSHAASLIAMGRVLTGCMPEDPGVEDFHVFTAGLSRFSRRGSSGKVGIEVEDGGRSRRNGDDGRELAPGTRILRPGTAVPDWRGGRGVGGGWDCVANGDCSFLSCGAERGW